MRASPEIQELTTAECERFLADNHVCRIAYSFRDRVDIEPVHYVYDDGWLYGRTEPGAKLETIAHHRWVAVEVDEIDGLFAWRSVVVHGAFYLLDPSGNTESRELHAHAIALLRRLVPDTFQADDPTPYRRIVFRISADEMRGRVSRAP
jgi:hypothetical protein